MSYDYATERPRLFSEEGVEMVRQVERTAQKACAIAGAVTAAALTRDLGGDTWLHLAAVDYLVEKGLLHEIKQAQAPMGQWRTFWLRGDLPA